MAYRKETGSKYEHVAKIYLENLGFSLLENNFQTSASEIDLIMQDSDFTVFVEVKSLSLNSPFTVYQSLTKKKKRKISSGIRSWINKNNQYDTLWRFDFIGIMHDNDKIFIEHYKFVPLK